MLQAISSLFEAYFHETPSELLALGANGSNRRYWRVRSSQHGCIAAYNDDVRENEAFFYFDQQMSNRGIRVPQLYAISDDRKIYLQQDLGDTTLYSFLYEQRRKGLGFNAQVLSLYQKVLSDLVQIQVRCADLNFSNAYPRHSFDRQSIQWDLNYFKYYFLKLAYIPFDEQLLQDDFDTLTDYLLQADDNGLLYRDFQSRNIMLVGEDQDPYYIDFQGCRQGALQYDVASLLYSAKSDIPEVVRQDLLTYYVGQLSKVRSVDTKQFKEQFYAFVMVRIMQAMGAYGYRGYFERKGYFLKSIPLAVSNLRLLIENHPLSIDIPHLKKVWDNIVNNPSLLALTHAVPEPNPVIVDPTIPAPTSELTVTVTSFSYKKGLPIDSSGNGGGYIFDCRALPNPGRYEQYKSYTGKDRPVIEFLEGDAAIEAFLCGVQSLVGPSVTKYIERKFTNLAVSFGCTGGQHRSVYCAERIAKWIAEKFDCHVVISHREQD